MGTGEIVTICSLNDEYRQSQLRTWTNAQEGINCNAILTAHIDGTIQFWNCLNLSKLRTLVSSESSCISCTLSSDDLFLFTLGSDGLLSIWAQQDQNKDKRKPIVLNFNKE